MRKLKLQVQMSVDGYVAGTNGELDWMTWDWDDQIKSYVNDLTDSVDTILLGRKMTEGFISHWANVITNPGDSDFPFAKKMIDIRKVVFTKTIENVDPKWKNTKLAKGNIGEEITQLKKQTGKDIIVYGGAGFVSSLIRNSLIDEYYLFVNPVAIGNGMTIFKNLEQKLKLKLVNTTAFSCGIVVLEYHPGEKETK